MSIQNKLQTRSRVTSVRLPTKSELPSDSSDEDDDYQSDSDDYDSEEENHRQYEISRKRFKSSNDQPIEFVDLDNDDTEIQGNQQDNPIDLDLDDDDKLDIKTDNIHPDIDNQNKQELVSEKGTIDTTNTTSLPLSSKDTPATNESTDNVTSQNETETVSNNE
ncbi:hypothetical protein DLAC_08432 [Tieghemostelium lacteum]|uniref:Uncharacterized protein n=1 Tax=Tieghemostelium lacteum TaxID=361077 RepID=A0A151ZC17_TIELA|nr:hypothetical protein DLAC_08432 [Tieghemostelium lacteum]|eukprot:KYQ91465.1 hypothetical protein DLAC_08432 [Tieghemostelium lacteum]